MSPYLSLLLVTVTAVLVAAACTESSDSSSDAGGDAEAEATETGPACELLSVDEVSEAIGSEVAIDEAASTGAQCSYLVDDGPVGVSLTLETVAGPAQFAALVTSGVEATEPAADALGSAEQMLVWAEAIGLQSGVARVGGAAVRVTWIQSPPTDDLAPLTTMLGLAAGRLPEQPFEQADAAGAATCERVPVEQLREVLGLPELNASPLGGSSACALSDPSGVNLAVDLPEGAAGPEQVESEGRVSVIEGEQFEWVPEPVEGLGSVAVWTEDPVSERSGELTVLFGEQLVRITSSANEPGPDVKERAVATARLVGGGAGG